MRTLALTLASFALAAAPALAQDDYNRAVDIGQKAPAFAGIPATISENGTLKDATLSLADIKEDVVVLTFLGNHCPVVQAYEDRLIDFVGDYKGKSVKVIGVSVNDVEQDKMPGIKEYTADKGSNYVYGYDESQEIGRAYGATNTPQFFVFDKDRTIRYMGAMDDNMNEARATKQYLRDAVDALLAGKAPEVDETQPKGCGVKYK
jgi:thiol-disulfide isomerase/thioredoxin